MIDTQNQQIQSFQKALDQQKREPEVSSELQKLQEEIQKLKNDSKQMKQKLKQEQDWRKTWQDNAKKKEEEMA